MDEHDVSRRVDAVCPDVLNGCVLLLLWTLRLEEKETISWRPLTL